MKGQAAEGSGYKRKASCHATCWRDTCSVKSKVASTASCPISSHTKKTQYVPTTYSKLLGPTETDLTHLKHTQKAKYAENRYILRISRHSNSDSLFTSVFNSRVFPRHTTKHVEWHCLRPAQESAQPEAPARCSCHIPKVGGRPRATTSRQASEKSQTTLKHGQSSHTERGSLEEAQTMHGEENFFKVTTIFSELRKHT